MEPIEDPDKEKVLLKMSRAYIFYDMELVLQA
jgi:hypothetical protein